MKKKLPVLTNDKSMMPEVLPDPRHSRSGSRNVRARTLARMETLMAATAVVAVADIGCHKEAANKDAGPPDAGPPNLGYAVVDPMPTPTFCPDIAPLIPATVTQDKGGILTITFPPAKGRADFKYVQDALPSIINGTLVGAKHDKGSLVVIVKPMVTTDTSVYVDVSLKAACDKGPVSIVGNVLLDRTKPHVLPTVTVSEY